MDSDSIRFKCLEQSMAYNHTTEEEYISRFERLPQKLRELYGQNPFARNGIEPYLYYLNVSYIQMLENFFVQMVDVVDKQQNLLLKAEEVREVRYIVSADQFSFIKKGARWYSWRKCFKRLLFWRRGDR